MEHLPVTPESILPVLFPCIPPSGHLARKAPNNAFITPKFLASVLNALASISVEKADSDPIAVALENTQDRTKLFVACDTGVSTQLSDHLSSIWVLIRQISDRVPLHHASPKANTRAFSDKEIREWERQLAAQIYCFSWQKFCARIHKRIASFLDGLKLMVESSAETQQPERHKLCKNLLDSFQSIRTFVTNTCPNDTMLVGINTVLLALSVGLRPYLDSEYSLLDSIQHRIEELSHPRLFIPIRRYLEKTFSLMRCHQTLLSAAHSRTFKPFLSKPLEIVSVPPSMDVAFHADLYHPRFRTFCENRPEVTDKIANDMARSPNEGTSGNKFSELPDLVRETTLDEEWRERTVRPLLYMLESKDSSPIVTDKEKRHLSAPARVHCECLLIAYFAANPTVRPHDHIATSKLLCYGCHVFLRAYNNVHGQSLHVRGTDARVLIPWVRPVLLDGTHEQVEEQMRMMMMDDLAAAWAHNRTDASEPMRFFRAADIREEIANATPSGTRHDFPMQLFHQAQSASG